MAGVLSVGLVAGPALLQGNVDRVPVVAAAVDAAVPEAAAATMVCNSYKSATFIVVFKPHNVVVRPAGGFGQYSCSGGNITKIMIPQLHHARFSGKCLNSGVHYLGRYDAYEYNVQRGRC